MSNAADTSWSGEFQLSVVSVGGRLGLYDCLRSMDDFVAGRPARLPALQDLLTQLEFGDRERTELNAGLSRMWSIIPPIDLDALKESDPDPPGLIALANIVCVWGAQRIARRDLQPDEPKHREDLRETEFVGRWIAEQIKLTGRTSRRGGIGRLDDMLATLKQERLDEAEERRQRIEEGAALQKGGMVSARKSEAADGLASLWRKLSRPGAAVPIGPPSEDIGPQAVELLDDPDLYDVDPLVPSLMPLQGYFEPLDFWCANRPLPLEQAYLQGLFDSAGLPESARAAWEGGRANLAELTGAIDAAVVAEARLDRRGSRALTVATIAASRHALLRFRHRQADQPDVLHLLAEIVAVLNLAMDGETDDLVGRLAKLSQEISTRVEVGGTGRKKAAIQAGRDARRLKAETSARKARKAKAKAASKANVGLGSLEAQRDRARVYRLIAGVVLVVVLGAGVVALRVTTQGPPPAATYEEMPVVALIRGKEMVVVRVDPVWPMLPQKERAPGVAALYDRLAHEMEGELVEVKIVDPRGKHLGGARAGRVYWTEAEATPTPVATPPPPSKD